MPKGKDKDRMSSDEEWVEDGWVVMDDDIHAKWVRTLVSLLLSYTFLRFSSLRVRGGGILEALSKIFFWALVWQRCRPPLAPLFLY